MYYEIHGEGPSLLLLHGATASISSEMFKAAIPFFANEFQVIAPEQMGHGRTADSIDRPLHYHDMAEDTVELMRQLAIDSAFVVGVSLGGVIGLDIAIHHPERVTRLALTGAHFRVDGIASKPREWMRTVKPEEWPVWAREDHERLSPDGPTHWPIFLERLRTMFMTGPNYTLEQMAGIRSPTLIIVGDNDWVTPEHAVETFRLIPTAKLCVIPGARHGVLPKETVLAFFKEPARSEPS